MVWAAMVDHPSKYCLFLRDVAERRDVGGKASAQSRLIERGLPVPNGFCVSAAAYDLWLRAPDGPSDKSKKGVPKVVEDDFRRVWDAMGWTDTGARVAVRSSAIAEDSSTASFAGQYRTHLNVPGVIEALQAVRSCWESARAAHVQQYAAHRGVFEGSSMGVLIQEMVSAEAAGVAFSADPVSGNRSVFYAEAVLGLGESLVSGETDPDLLVWMGRDASVLRYDALSDDLPLPIQDLRRLGLLIASIEDIAGRPQDIEWAWTRSASFQILQARPIAARRTEVPAAVVPRWCLPGRPIGGWSDDVRYVFGYWDEYNARSIAPLNWDLYESAAWEANIRMFDYLGSLPHVEQIAILHHDVPVAIDPAGRVQPDPEEPQVRVEMSPIVDWQGVFDHWASKASIIRSQMSPLQSLPNETLLNLLGSASADLRANLAQRMATMGEWINPHTDADPVQKFEREIRELLSPWVPDSRISEVLLDLAAGVSHDTDRMNDELFDIISMVARKPDVLSADRICHKVETFLSRYGHYHFDGQTLEVHPELLWSQLSAAAVSGHVPRSLTSEARRKYAERVELLRSDLPSDVFMKTLERARFMRTCIQNRETSKARESLPRPLIELLCQECGRRLRSRGLIDKAAEVYLLRLRELEAAIDRPGESPFPSRAALIERHRIMQWKATHSWLPERFHDHADRPNELTYVGEPASPGTARGRARVVRGIEDFGDIQDGEVVVAYTTNPVWTQIFVRVSAIVVERGGATSHAAVVAREYGIPAVAGIAGITRFIKTGEFVEVIGDRGLVCRIDKANDI